MTVAELIKELQEIDSNASVYTFDSEAGEYSSAWRVTIVDEEVVVIS